MKHKHHIIPKHMGGTNDELNIIELSIEEHALAHKILYEEHGKLEDYLAWKGLLGQIGKEEILKELYKENGKKQGLTNIGKKPWNYGLTKSDPRVMKIAEANKSPKSEPHIEAMKKPKAVTENMGRYERTDEVKSKLSSAAKIQFSSEESRNKHSDIMKRKKTCPFCGLESNASNVTRHMKKCNSFTSDNVF